MFWKIYFWSYFLLCLVGGYAYLNNFLTITDVLGIFLALLIGMGVYSYAYSKHFFNPEVWLMIFYFASAAIILEGVDRVNDFSFIPNLYISKYVIGTANWTVTSILIIPALCALWILGNRQTSKKKKK